MSDRKKKIEKVRRSDLLPERIKDVYQSDLEKLERSIESNDKVIKKALEKGRNKKGFDDLSKFEFS